MNKNEQCSPLKKEVTMVKSRTLLFIAGIVWLIAGYNVLKIGIMAYVGHIHIVNLFISFIIFFIFLQFIFRKLVKKHTARIQMYGNERKYVWNFFDIPSFIIMVFMITMGIIIRVFHLLPEIIIAIFYFGLGSALFGAGINFIKNYIDYTNEN